MDYVILHDWASFAIRWLHVVTAIAWIGSSFYFIALDLGLQRAPGLPQGAHGEEWQVHGGGFYHITKYLVAPERMPEHLTWFKWESYATWLSGAALAFGRSTGTPEVISGAATMNTISSTSMTSTSGVTLISASGR